MNRRDFLKKSAFAALLLGTGCTGADLVPTTSLAPTELPWDALARSLQGPLFRPGQPGFAQIAAPWNLRYLGLLPAGIARCQSVDDVRSALNWARSNSVPLVCRSGGHSYSGYSLTTGLMIDVSQMNSLSYNPANGQAVVGGGARNRDVYAALRAPRRAITHGRCRGVGVGGLVLGGGVGFNMRAHGLTCDQLVETEIVLASGEVLVCNEQQNADLFWAARGGGGGNFGIHTSFTFQTFPVEDITVYQITWTTDLEQVLTGLLQILSTAPDRLGCKVSVTAKRAGLSVSLLGQLFGTPAELDGLLASLPVPAQRDVRQMFYWDGQEFLSEDGAPEYSHERSRFVFGTLSPAAVATIFDFLRRWPGTSLAGTWKFFLQGGQVAAKAPGDTAFVHRQGTMLTSAELEWSPSDGEELIARNQAWLNEFHAAMAPFTSAQSYQNFIDASQTDFLRAYYGSNLERLVEVKRSYDPGNVFHYPQSIPLSLA